MIGRSVLSFARGSGLSLSSTTGVIEGTEYTIEVLFRFDRLDGYRKSSTSRTDPKTAACRCSMDV
jgi:hypothetical protein